MATRRDEGKADSIKDSTLRYNKVHPARKAFARSPFAKAVPRHYGPATQLTLFLNFINFSLGSAGERGWPAGWSKNRERNGEDRAEVRRKGKKSLENGEDDGERVSEFEARSYGKRGAMFDRW